MAKKETDYQIIEQCRRGSSKAQYVLFNQHCRMVYNVAFRMVNNRDDANEITQETFIKVFEKIKHFRGDAPIEAWIRKIALNQSIRFVSKRNKMNWKVQISEVIPDTEVSMFQIDEKEELNLAMEQLPDGARIVFVMYAIEGYKHHEIAKALKISESTSKSQFQRARLLMRQSLKELNRV